MDNQPKANFRKINLIVGWSVFAVALITYLLTVAPTTSYWDCGEFIATSYTLGIPHPPGAPFFLLLGRFFSMIPFVSDIGLRVNIISVLSSAFSVMFLYFISVCLIKSWRGVVKDNYDAMIVFGSSAIGALTFAFTDTFWFNAVEAEVYAISMFFVSFIMWLVMIWAKDHKNPNSSRYILLIMLLVGLGTGVHLLNILTLPVVLFIMWFYDKRMTIITGLGILFSIIVLFGLPLEYKIYSLVVFVILTIISQRFEGNEDISLAFIMPLLLIIGYSTYIMIYIRAGLDPAINENDPSNWERMLAYLNREQYGDSAQMSDAIKFMFGDANRKYSESVQKMGASNDPWGGHWIFFWKYQVVEMYVRYFNWQFIGKNLDAIKTTISFNHLYGLPFLVGVWGVLHHFFKDWKKALAYTFLFLAMGIGLIIYQNQDWGQPRERDYFYVGSFFVFSIWIGIGISSILEALKDNLNLKKLILPVLLIAMILPILEINANLFTAGRSGNYLAWDYSKNILESCDENSILFTNGDNDTFPLWYLQEVEGIRTDVQIVNLSLLNTDWYIKQLKRKNRIPELIKYSYAEIDRNFNQRKASMETEMVRYWPETRKLFVPSKNGLDKLEWEMKATTKRQTQDGSVGFIRIQDQMVLEMIMYNAKSGWKRPITFAVTVASSNFIGLDDFMQMDGLVFTLQDKPVSKNKRAVDPEVLYDKLFVKFKDHYRNLGDKDIYYDDNKIRLLQNYRSAFLQLAMLYVNDIGIIDNSKKVELDSTKAYTYDDFLDFSSKEKVSYVLQKMDQFVPSDNIKFSQELVVLDIAKFHKKVGEMDKANRLLWNVDVFKMRDDERIKFLLYALARDFDEYGMGLINEMANRYIKQNNISSMIEIYLGLVQVKKIDLGKELVKFIETGIKNLDDSKAKSKSVKEFSVALYHSEDIKGAIKVLDDHLSAVNNSDMEALELKYQIYYLSKRYEEALTAINKIFEVDPNSKNRKKLVDQKNAIEQMVKMNKQLSEKMEK